MFHWRHRARIFDPMCGFKEDAKDGGRTETEEEEGGKDEEKNEEEDEEEDDEEEGVACASTPGALYDLSYEELVLLREQSAQRLLEFVGLRRDAMSSVMGFHEQGLNSEGLGNSRSFIRWRGELAAAFAELAAASTVGGQS
jgi:hypothetical protein